MKFPYHVVGALAGFVVLAPWGLAAQTTERLSDNSVKAIIESVDQARDRFEDQLDGKVKDSVIRSATGEVKVSSSLDDFQELVDRLKSRFTDDYSASAEVTAVLRGAKSVDELVKGLPAGTKGSSNWEAVTGQLQRLAAAYGASYPLPEGAAVRRFNDAEVAAAAGAVATQAEQIKNAADNDKTMAKADRLSFLAYVDAVIEQAKTLQSHLKDGQPSSAEVRALHAAVTDLTTGARPLPPAIQTMVGGLRAPLDKIDLAFVVAPAKTN
jgi:hypothetical protein